MPCISLMSDDQMGFGDNVDLMFYAQCARMLRGS